jgi:glycosyltransferase involved in cell wall biosynthesis
LLIKCLGRGGAEQLLVHLMRHRDRDRFDYEVAYILEAENALVGELEAAGVKVHCLGARSNRDLSWMPRLRALLLRDRFDIVHFHLPYAAGLGRLVAATVPHSARPAFVSTEHNMWNKMAIVLRALNRLTIHMDDAVLAVTEASRRSMPRTQRRRALVVVHGIDTDRLDEVLIDRAHERSAVRFELGIGEDEVLALTVANLRREKAYDVLLPAAKAVIDAGLPMRFLAAGHGPQQDDLTALREDLELGDRFRFLGRRDDILRLLMGADLFVLASRQEGLPVSVMEAICAGVPLVVTAVGGLPLLLHDGVDALMVPPEDARALADAITLLASDAQLRARLAKAASMLAPAFDIARASREIEAVYAEVAPSTHVTRR